MAIPVIEAFTNNDSGGVSTNKLVLNFPDDTNAATGDVMWLLLASDKKDSTEDIWTTPPDHTKHDWTGDATADVVITIFSKPWDGTEAATLQVDRTSSHETSGVYMRVSGGDTTTLIHALLKTAGSNTNSYTADGVTTTEPECLIICYSAFDGADGGPFTITGSGWAWKGSQFSGAGSQDVSSQFSARNQTSSGAGVDCLISTTGSDGQIAIQFAIAPAASGGDVSATPGVGAAISSGLAPVSKAGVSAVPNAGSLATAGLAPGVSSGVAADPATGALAIDGLAPALAVGVSVQPDAGSITTVGLAPTASAGSVTSVSATPGVGATISSGFVPTAKVGVSVLTNVGSTAVEGLVPVARAGISIIPASGEIVTSGFAPDASGGASVLPANIIISAGDRHNIDGGSRHAGEVTARHTANACPRHPVAMPVRHVKN